jgi:hypothetical protein
MEKMSSLDSNEKKNVVRQQAEVENKNRMMPHSESEKGRGLLHQGEYDMDIFTTPCGI